MDYFNNDYESRYFWLREKLWGIKHAKCIPIGYQKKRPSARVKERKGFEFFRPGHGVHSIRSAGVVPKSVARHWLERNQKLLGYEEVPF